ncbi:hypothetical protein L2725_15690 [Shewanella corallii]|uniref:CopL family metal-binding regulatory protein n=1 Tax=Shewanella corallii TaxID=560080 RepID=A0ABT0NBK9_9GAMM|nr:hypothetical protein [Shewanella corallii]MCL2915202.1 hypothetical protein [Shewanella corallii]
MINRFKSPLLSLLTMLALLVQGVAFGAQTMDLNQQVSHQAMMMDDMHCAPHSAMDMSAMDCCSTDIQASSNSCCEGQGSCSGDCVHCLSISVTGTLLSDSYWPEALPHGILLSAYIPHFHSISLPMALRPPIA